MVDLIVRSFKTLLWNSSITLRKRLFFHESICTLDGYTFALSTDIGSFQYSGENLGIDKIIGGRALRGWGCKCHFQIIGWGLALWPPALSPMLSHEEMLEVNQTVITMMK